jgi:hypothetical protein
VQRVLEPAFKGGTVEENMSRFSEMINETAVRVGMGSNRQPGTAINVARRTYSTVRTEFGRLAEAAGLSVKGRQVHHAIDQLAHVPSEALNPANLSIVTGNAATEGTLHNLGHASLEKNLPRLEAWLAKGAAEAKSLVTAEKLAAAAPKLEATATGVEQAARGLKSVPKLGPIGTGLAVIGLVLTVGASSAKAATAPTATTTLDKIEQVTETASSVVDVGGAVMSLHPTGGLIVGVATATTLVAEKGIEVTGGDKRIVDSATAVHDFAKEHGASEDQALVAGAVTAGVSGIAEGVTVLGELSNPIGWVHLGVKAYMNKK